VIARPVIELRCRPAGQPATEVRIGDGAVTALVGRATGRRLFALLDAAIDERGLRPTAPPDWIWHVVRGGEGLKTMATAESVLRAMVQAGCDRASVLCAIGGGTVGDLGGFCASLFLRGIELWQVPTTTLAMVDSAVGGKTAVNLPEGKNLAGTVHPAALVAIEPAFALAEPERGYRSGLAEAIKMGLGLDAGLFALLERDAAVLDRARDTAAWRASFAAVVHRSLAAKIAVVEQDLRETGRRRLLNLGHTLGHALEAFHRGTVPHGECIARGLWFALDVARELGAMRSDDVERAGALLRRYQHPRLPLPTPPGELMAFVLRDKKVEGGVVHFAVPTGIGTSEVRPLEPALLQRLLERG
jgi:3-dehydroquinate synthase